MNTYVGTAQKTDKAAHSGGQPVRLGYGGVAKIKVIKKRVEELIPYSRNSRTHSDAQVAQIAASIRPGNIHSYENDQEALSAY